MSNVRRFSEPPEAVERLVQHSLSGTSRNTSGGQDRADTRYISRWTHARERHLRAWVVQMSRAGFLMQRAASLLRTLRILMMFMSSLCTAYTSIIPVATLGCLLVQGSACTNLQISSIVMAVLGSITAIMEGRLGPGDAAAELSTGSKFVLKLARDVDLMLQRSVHARVPVDEFCQAVARDYDDIIQNLPSVPRFVYRTNELLNFTLLSAYIEAPNTRVRNDIHMDQFLVDKLENDFEQMGRQHQASSSDSSASYEQPQPQRQRRRDAYVDGPDVHVVTIK